MRNIEAILKENRTLKKQLATIEKNSKKNKSTTCRDCGSSRGKPRSFSFGRAGGYKAVQCDSCWNETLYEDLLD